jgi:hypothetical protein
MRMRNTFGARGSFATSNYITQMTYHKLKVSPSLSSASVCWDFY